MIVIHVTSNIVGSAILTEAPGGRGQRTNVPLYEAWAHAQRETHRFGVTRCSSHQVFGNVPEREIYDWLGECPPSVPEEPYFAIPVKHYATGTFALRLYDRDSPHQDSLRGMGPIMRSNVLIHIGDPASSSGCLTIGGGRAELDRLQAFIEKHQVSGANQIQVFVAERRRPGRAP